MVVGANGDDVGLIRSSVDFDQALRNSENGARAPSGSKAYYGWFARRPFGAQKIIDLCLPPRLSKRDGLLRSNCFPYQFDVTVVWQLYDNPLFLVVGGVQTCIVKLSAPETGRWWINGGSFPDQVQLHMGVGHLLKKT